MGSWMSFVAYAGGVAEWTAFKVIVAKRAWCRSLVEYSAYYIHLDFGIAVGQSLAVQMCTSYCAPTHSSTLLRLLGTQMLP